MSVDAWITAVVVLGVLVALGRDLAPPVLVVLTGVVVLLLADVLDTSAALAGFANPAPVTVAALYIVARAVQRTGAVTAAVEAVLPSASEGPPTPRHVLARLLPPVMATSGLLNNTPIVAVLAPDLVTWAESRGMSASRLLIPLSYGAILGGVLTAVGTSTTLVVSGLMEQAGMAPLGLLEPLRLALPVAVLGGVVVVTLAPRLLPERRPAHSALRGGARSFTVEVRVLEGGSIDGSTLAQAGLRALTGVYCVQVRRGQRVIAPVAPDTELRGGDVLTFVGDVQRVVDLQHRRGLALSEAHHAHGLGGAAQGFYEAVVGPSSALVGTTLKAVGFRAAYGAAVVAIHRAGEPVEDKLGEVPLRVGDTLLCMAGPGFERRAEGSGAFVLVAAMGADAPLDTRRSRLVLAVLAAMLVLAGSGLLTILEAALAAAVALVGLRALTTSQARHAVDLPVILVIAGAFGLGAAVEGSGLAQVVAGMIATATAPLGSAGVVIGLLVLVVLLTEVVTNNAAAVLAFPIAVSAAETAAVDVRLLLVAVAVAASLSFVTPLGYQTNLMVHGLGGYRFGDFARLGVPTSIVTVSTLAVTVLSRG